MLAGTPIIGHLMADAAGLFLTGTAKQVGSVLIGMAGYTIHGMSPQASSPFLERHGKSRIKKTLLAPKLPMHQLVQFERQTYKRALIMRLGDLNRM